MANYAYDKLGGTGRPLRVLTLFPANKLDAEIHCRLVSTDLDHDPSYMALSYCWGDSSEKSSVILNGSTFLISSSLATALRYIRANFCQGKTATLWADALCINQDDSAERGSQVQMMGDIFSKALKVILWVGEEFGSSDLAMDVIHAIGIGLVTTRDFDSWDVIPGMKEKKAWEAVDDLWDRNVWKRVWILQEFVLGRELTIICGNKSIDWSVLDSAFVSWSEDLVEMGHHVWQNLEQGLAKEIMWNNWRDMKEWHVLRRKLQRGEILPDILQLLASSFDSIATDPRDMIYGLLGVTKHDVTADYSKSTREVYVELATKLIEEKRLSILCCSGCGIAEPQNQSCVLPSWTPDWRARNPAEFPWSHFFWSYENYNASPSSSKSALMATPSHVTVEGETLFATAIMCQQITQLFASDFLLTDEFWTGWVLENAQRSYGRTHMPLLQAFFRTILLDIDQKEITSKELSQRLDDSGKAVFDLAAGFLLFLSMKASQHAKETIRESQTPAEAFAHWAGLDSSISESDVVTPLQDLFIGDSGSWNDLSWSEVLYSTNGPLVMTFLEKLVLNRMQRSFFVTADGYFGIGPRFCQESDIVAVILGLTVPAILRKVEDHFEYIGPCFILGFMDGEALEDVEDGKLEVQKIEIK
jgi:hypothetical protein